MRVPRRVRGHRMLTRYWFEFDWGDQAPMRGLGFGCGVTAFDREDALRLITEVALADEALPPIKSVTEDVDVSRLDQGHVIPNMAAPSQRGIWFAPESLALARVPEGFHTVAQTHETRTTSGVGAPDAVVANRKPQRFVLGGEQDGDS